jgi:hypothetical protein
MYIYIYIYVLHTYNTFSTIVYVIYRDVDRFCKCSNGSFQLSEDEGWIRSLK